MVHGKKIQEKIKENTALQHLFNCLSRRFISVSEVGAAIFDKATANLEGALEMLWEKIPLGSSELKFFAENWHQFLTDLGLEGYDMLYSVAARAEQNFPEEFPAEEEEDDLFADDGAAARKNHGKNDGSRGGKNRAQTDGASDEKNDEKNAGKNVGRNGGKNGGQNGEKGDGNNDEKHEGESGGRNDGHGQNDGKNGGQSGGKSDGRGQSDGKNGEQNGGQNGGEKNAGRKDGQNDGKSGGKKNGKNGGTKSRKNEGKKSGRNAGASSDASSDEKNAAKNAGSNGEKNGGKNDGKKGGKSGGQSGEGSVGQSDDMDGKKNARENAGESDAANKNGEGIPPRNDDSNEGMDCGHAAGGSFDGSGDAGHNADDEPRGDVEDGYTTDEEQAESTVSVDKILSGEYIHLPSLPPDIQAGFRSIMRQFEETYQEQLRAALNISPEVIRPDLVERFPPVHLVYPELCVAASFSGYPVKTLAEDTVGRQIVEDVCLALDPPFWAKAGGSKWVCGSCSGKCDVEVRYSLGDRQLRVTGNHLSPMTRTKNGKTAVQEQCWRYFFPAHQDPAKWPVPRSVYDSIRGFDVFSDWKVTLKQCQEKRQERHNHWASNFKGEGPLEVYNYVRTNYAKLGTRRSLKKGLDDLLLVDFSIVPEPKEKGGEKEGKEKSPAVKFSISFTTRRMVETLRKGVLRSGSPSRPVFASDTRYKLMTKQYGAQSIGLQVLTHDGAAAANSFFPTVLTCFSSERFECFFCSFLSLDVVWKHAFGGASVPSSTFMAMDGRVGQMQAWSTFLDHIGGERIFPADRNFEGHFELKMREKGITVVSLVSDVHVGVERRKSLQQCLLDEYHVTKDVKVEKKLQGRVKYYLRFTKDCPNLFLIRALWRVKFADMPEAARAYLYAWKLRLGLDAQTIPNGERWPPGKAQSAGSGGNPMKKRKLQPEEVKPWEPVLEAVWPALCASWSRGGPGLAAGTTGAESMQKQILGAARTREESRDAKLKCKDLVKFISDDLEPILRASKPSGKKMAGFGGTLLQPMIPPGLRVYEYDPSEEHPDEDFKYWRDELGETVVEAPTKFYIMPQKTNRPRKELEHGEENSDMDDELEAELGDDYSEDNELKEHMRSIGELPLNAAVARRLVRMLFVRDLEEAMGYSFFTTFWVQWRFQ